MYILFFHLLNQVTTPQIYLVTPTRRMGTTTAWLLLIKEYFYNVVLVIFHTLIIYFGCKTLDLQK